MKIYFGDVTSLNLEEPFEVDGVEYEFCISADDLETVRIEDSIGRMVPFSIDNLNELITALEGARDMLVPLRDAYEDVQAEMEYLGINE